ncbi:alpha/beta hydrolase [Bacillus spongiae]|uniref:Alpha/beta hydrolase n=1 Tax=Bacillus spongiae TaxID=2683610 RepID=A0ABU8HBJ5_9BACI
MESLTYTKVLNKTLAIYGEGGSLEAYHYISKHADHVEGNKAQLYNFQYSLAAASGLEDEALALFKEATIDHQFWYSYEYLIEDEDLDVLRKYDEFQKLVQLCKEREEAAKKSVKPDLNLIMPQDKETNSLFIALHGDQENREMAEGYWKSIVSKQYMLALPQSSQIEFSEAYNWEDVEQGTGELKNHIDTIMKTNQMNQENTLIGGFSAGAKVALHSLMTEEVKAKGFIFVAPWLPDLDEWEENLHILSENGLKGYVICGDKDEDCLESSEKLVAILKKHNIPHTFKLVKNLDHDYPDDFDQILREAVEFITSPL